MALVAVAATACVTTAGRAPTADGLAAAERAFAATMAERDLDGFRSFLADDVVFLSGGEAARGPDAVVAAWRRFFADAAAPFSWEPEVAEVSGGGAIGFTSGPVRGPGGERIGTFNSVWRHDGSRWRVVFDRGCPPCPDGSRSVGPG